MQLDVAVMPLAQTKGWTLLSSFRGGGFWP